MTKEKDLRIAHFLDASAVGGIEQHVATLAGALNKVYGIQPYILLWKDYGNEELLQRLESAGCPVHIVQGSYDRLRRFLRDYEIESLHSHGYKANLISRWLGIRFGVRSIATHHNGDVGTGRVRLYTMLDQLTAQFSENWAVSEGILNRLPKQARLMPNFVEALNIRKDQGSEVVFVGRLEQVKRPDRLLNIARQCPDVQFKVFGTGTLQPQLMAQRPANVQLMGFENNPETIWRNAGLCVICSDTEGLPLTALEAMAAGVPVIATAVGQLPALIEHGQNGWLAETDADFADIILRWQKSNWTVKEDIAEYAKYTVQNKYSVDACLPTYIEALSRNTL
ncbi:glycosyltransferase family 4 protein [Reinekea marinisedimentorum]|uniref:Glycosyltransferase involved in cell wall biosynthesis n=1 Tax=Reinekea marinisedimentorum TaxID=230495 RepID=A0A4R3IA81_9GAMM|nr:glycosyltransferase family 4 protein [Reinekea marinisedimentorum]TCS42397.1 glycosyltransferase involved in cell wall biosynthesis [Reinekea marinisedimentorum]